MVCEHKDGWVLISEVVINPELTNDNLEGEFYCNHLGCIAKKKMKFDIDNINEVN